MPFKKGYSKKVIGMNISEGMKKGGMPQKQAVAAALDTARRAAKKKGVPLSKIKGLKPKPKKD